jgi:hypothetical protein
VPQQFAPKAWAESLLDYPHRDEAVLALHGIIYGARLLYDGPHVSRGCHNLPSATEQSTAVTTDIVKECAAGRIAGPFPVPPAEPFITSPLGTVPKKGTDEHRRIHHLSHPWGDSVNDHIQDIPLTYASFDVSPRLTALRPLSSPPLCPVICG